MATHKVLEYRATGRRKTAVARVRIALGVGKFNVNGKSLESYFPPEHLQRLVSEPFEATDTQKQYDVMINVRGGGLSGQAGAIRHGIARALVDVDQEFKPMLKQAGLLSRDPRMKERKKYGQPGARKKVQFSKR